MGQILEYPDTPLAELRRHLRHCRNSRMLDRWSADFRKQRGKLLDADAVSLAAEAAAVQFTISMAQAESGR